MNDTKKPETAQRKVRKRVAKRLRKAFMAGQITTEQLSTVTARGPRTIATWLDGSRLLPSTVLMKVEGLLLVTR